MANKDLYRDCPNILKDFLFYIHTIKGRSERTVEAYYIDLKSFLRFLNLKNGLVNADTPFEEIKISNITIENLKSISLSDVYEYLHFLSVEKDNSSITRSRKVSSIRSFFNYLTVKMHLLEVNPMKELEVPSIKKSLPKYLTLDQCIDLLKNIDGEYKERDYCIITMFLNCGMRLSELVGLNLSDISDNTIRLLGKGNKERIVYLNDACISALNQYIPIRNKQTIHQTSQNALFISRNGQRISKRRVQEIVELNLKKAGLSNHGLSTHKLRHTAATIMYQYGDVDIKVLQEILGHVNLGTTEIYTHISSKQLEQAAKSTPLSKITNTKKKQ
ncbi:tyrosine recombinase XerC [Paludicola sp. MB14-C6]|uniref:tyrosine recombinase XerC n=1 Tax=Paludihabitans sp. MB14-C6 TaxID=3070656 RepID=UPI0027DE21E0|nr:tyrosine recombinase XerC [Paludicola sp. MB14-C6]WMJ23337.1 tyrosine recombinase XerC [Paludicola sp. MB14-C6]